MDKDVLNSLKINSIAKELRKDSRSIGNRLQSIKSDYEWITAVQDAYLRPLVPNERCGLWYVPPELRIDTSYFKSTDGHTTQWSFSTRRLNFHLLPLIKSNNGVIIVDSTRRGKKMPDALSKSIPIWCAVLNYIMFGPCDNNWLFTPPDTVSKSEASQIIKLIPDFVDQVLNLQLTSKTKLLEVLDSKPLRPIWVYPGLYLPSEIPTFDDFNPVICCTSSHMVQDGIEKSNNFFYVQGAADDHELWAGKLTPELFWDNRDKFDNVGLSDSDLLNLVDDLHNDKVNDKNDSVRLDMSIMGSTNICVGRIEHNMDYCEFTNKYKDVDVVVILSEFCDFTNMPASNDNDEKLNMVRLSYKLQSSKKGSNKLREILPGLMSFVEQSIVNKKRIIILCDSGKDLSIGLLLVILCTYYNVDWEKLDQKNELVSKDLIKKHLGKVLELRKVNPSRATLQSINSFLM